jgi:transposase InsO family protein
MAWLETRVMDERIKFISEVLEGDYSMSELCLAYNISRKCGYKWLSRYDAGGMSGLNDLCRAPHNHPNAITADVKSAILSIKHRFPFWGPAKIDFKIRKLNPHWSNYPALSTIGLVLKREGLVCLRRRRRKASPTQGVLTPGMDVNDVWCADFKGHFKTRDSSRCNPLTITDHYSRYLLCCRHLNRMSYKLVKPQFERVFREYGLPLVIRTDNGTPFSSQAICGLSRLSVWWIKLGIHPERIEPGKPEQNGRHERMHRTLKQETASPPSDNLRSQQKRFDKFIDEYNEHRPHEAIEMQTPASIYKSSPREFPSRLPQPHYPDRMKICKVYVHGDILYKGRLFLSESLRDEYVGVEEVDEDKSVVWFYDYKLGTIDHVKRSIEPAKCHPLSAGVNPCTDDHNSTKVLPMCSV